MKYTCSFPFTFISIHAPPRGATAESVTDATPSLFQFTPLREGRLLTVSAACSPFLFQFTPLREGRQKFYPVYDWKKEISIHAPPRGATTG